MSFNYNLVGKYGNGAKKADWTNNPEAMENYLYHSLAEETDLRNEILMDLQRRKMWSYAENAKVLFFFHEF